LQKRRGIVTSVATVAADLIRSNAYVDGRWVDPDGGETFPVVNPATGETIDPRVRKPGFTGSTEVGKL
jgi:hypothetical protein